jgi:predicted lipoprotein with Yx(FWY)xxD motif
MPPLKNKQSPSRSFVRGLFVTIALLLSAPDANAGADPKSGASMGFVVTSFFTAIYETKTLDECPSGLAATNDEIWWKSLSPKDRIAPTHDGDLEPAARMRASSLRGSHGEDVCWNPTSVEEPPLRTVKGRISYGLNLDGTQDGHQTAKSCAHDKFAGPDGEVGIDNQLYRALGCIHGWRADGYVETNANSDRLSNSKGTILLEVTGSHALPLEGDVTVKIYKAGDSLPKDSKGNILPYASYRIDDIALYGATLHGSVKDGVLVTEPTDARLPYFGNNQETNFLIRGLRLRLSIDPVTGAAKGMIAGYHDVDNLWDYIRKSGYLAATGHFSCPAVYQAFHTLADGVRDPQTGACTALSAAYNIEAVPAFVIHRDPDTPKASAASASATTGNISDPSAAMPPDVSLRRTTVGQILTTSSGMTLYTKGASTDPDACSSRCLDDWQPFVAPEMANKIADWSTTQRPEDRSAQWTFKGEPLYLFSKDTYPGDIKGETEKDDWRAVIIQPSSPMPNWITVQNSDVGQILADPRGRTLYVLNGSLDEILKKICDQSCLDRQWVPFKQTPSMQQPAGDWTSLPADNSGSRQWAFKGKPVYLFRGDTDPALIGGNHFGGASVSTRDYWSVIPAPSQITN